MAVLQSCKRIPQIARRNLLALLIAGHSCAALADQAGELQLTGPGHSGQEHEAAAPPQPSPGSQADVTASQTGAEKNAGAEKQPLRSSNESRAAAATSSQAARIALLPLGTDGWVAREAVARRDAESLENEPQTISSGQSIGSGLKAVDPPRLSHVQTETSADSGSDDHIQRDTDEDRIVVRELRIGRDGQPAGQGMRSSRETVDERSEAVSDRSDRSTSRLTAEAARSHHADDSTRHEESAHESRASTYRLRQRDPASQHVGDMPDDQEFGRGGDALARAGDIDRNSDQDDDRDHSSTQQSHPRQELDYAGYPKTPLKIKRSVERLQPAIRTCLRHYYDRPEQAEDRSNWGMLHAIMVYGVDTPIIVGPKAYSAVAWIAGNNACRGKRLLKRGPRGILADQGVGLQGHQAQLLAVLSLIGVPADYPLYAAQKKYSVSDLIKAEAGACRKGAELTFTLIGLSHYLSTDDAWISDDGQRWDFERMIREELSQPVIGAACGGTHRLMGLAHALRCRRAEGLPITGQWLRAEKFLDDFVEYTYQLQNRDGSMSTNWFEGREDNGDLDRKVQTTGHIVEWLLTMASDSQLQDPRLVRSIEFLLHAMYSERDHDWSIGPKGHALRSLAMFYERVYDEGAPWRPSSVARHARSSYR